MKIDKATGATLQAACATMAHLAAQYRLDRRQLKAIGLDWLACRVGKWYSASEHHQDKFIDRLLYTGNAPAYDTGSVTTAPSVTGLLQRASTLVYAALDQFVGFRKSAWETRADGVTDLFEHAVQELEHQAVKIEREVALIGKIGENDYIASRLEDA